jgi:hypothetical protein
VYIGFRNTANDKFILLVDDVKVQVVGSLPVTLVSLRGHVTGNRNIVEWTTANESGMDCYELETSADGRTFTKAGNMMAKGQSSNDYLFTDMLPYAPVSFYRLKMKGKDGGNTYSAVVRLERGGDVTAMKVYPNRVKEHNMTLQLDNLPAGHYALQLYNTTGQLVMRQWIDHAGGSATTTVKLPGALTPGMYLLALQQGELSMAQRIVIE